MFAFAGQRNGEWCVEAANTVSRQRDLHVVEAGAVVVMVLPTIRWAIVSRGEPVIITAIVVIVVGSIRSVIVRAVHMDVFQGTVRAAQAVTRDAGEETQMDQQGENDGTGEAHVAGAAD